MIKNYVNGEEFIKDNEEFLNSKPNQNTFFYLDAKLLTEHTKINYSFKIEEGNKKILVLKVVPFKVMLFGDIELAGQVVDNIMINSYDFNGFLCEEELGKRITRILAERYNLECYEALAMDFMTCNEKNHDYYDEVEVATINDVDRIYLGLQNFIRDCGLQEVANKEKLTAAITKFRVVRVNGEVASFALSSYDGENKSRVTNVYTFDEYRGMGLARKVVTNLVNEIIDSGKYATLNVDQKNPISYHLYTSIGFKKDFSQGEFRFKK